MQVDGTAANGASAGHGNAGHAGAGDERAEHQGTGAHGFDDFVFGDGIGEIAATDAGAVVGRTGAQLHFSAHGGEQTAFRFNVAHLGDVFEGDFVFSKNGCGHAGERGVFGPGDSNGADEWIATANDELIHEEEGFSLWD